MPNKYAIGARESLGQMRPAGAVEDQEKVGFIRGFGESAVSSIPELFGAEPWENAQAFRDQNPWSGFASEMVGMAVPYMGAEAAVLKIPRLAKAVASGVKGLTGGAEALGFRGAAASPIWQGAARELVINAPVEASRLAVASTVYPENFDEVGWDVATSLGVAGGIGAGVGWLGKAKKRAKRAVIDGVEDFTANTWQLAALEEGAQVRGAADPVAFANDLERAALTDNPGKTGVKGAGQKIDYMQPIAEHPIEKGENLNSLLIPGKGLKGSNEPIRLIDPDGKNVNIPTGLNRQYLVENPSATKGRPKWLKPGQQQDIIDQLPEGIDSIRKLASTVQHPRYLTVIDKDGARELSGKLSLPGMMKVGKTSMIQDKNGLWFVAHRLSDGKGQAIGKGAGKIKVGETYLVGKMLDPGLLEPDAKKLSEMVTAPWAKQRAAYHAGRRDNIFSNADDAYLSIVNKQSMDRMKGMDHKEKVGYLAEKLGKIKADGVDLLDSKFNFKDSKNIQDMAESIAISLKPTSHLQLQNRDYAHYFGLMKNGQKTGEEWVRKAFFGAQKLKPGTSAARAIIGTGKSGREVVSGYKGHDPLVKIWEAFTEEENDLVTRMANADVLSPKMVQKLVADGSLSAKAGEAVEKARALNNDFVNDLIPVMDDAGHTGIEWLKNHLGIPRTTRGHMFAEIRDGKKLKHVAWGKNADEVEREARAVVEEAKAAGENWTFDPAKKRDFPTESSEALANLQRDMSKGIGKTTEDGEILARAMRRLSAIKSTTGKHPGIPISSGALKKRKNIPNVEGHAAPFTKDETLNAMYGHMSQLSKFGAMQNWQSRFGREAKDMLKGHDPKMFEDLMLKQRQYLGIESQFTNALNSKLRKVLPGDKPATAIAAAVNESIFALTLGLFNMSHAILNVLSPIQTVMPWIMHSATLPPQALADLMGHTITANAKGEARGLSAYVEPLKVMGSAVKLLGNPGEELGGLIERAINDGVFHPQLFEDWVGGQAKNRIGLFESFGKEGMVGFLRKLATFAGEESEKMSRLIAWNASYRVGKDIAGLEGDALYHFMKRAQEVTMFGYHTVDRANLTSGPIGSMFGLFKNWQMHFIGNMMQYAKLAVNEGNFGPLVWAGGSAVALGGLGATPLIAIADGLGNWENDANSSYLWMKENYSDHVPGTDTKMSDAAYFGLPAFLGVSLQASSTLPGTDVRNEVTSLMSLAMWNRAKMMYKTYEKADEFHDATGMNPFQDPNIRDMAMQATMPRFMIRAMSLTEEDYVRSMSTGYPQVRNVSPFGRLMHGMGVNVVEIESMQEASQVLYKHEEQMNAKVRGLGRAYYDAISNGDTAEATKVVHTALGLSIPLDKIARSAMAIKKREETGDILSRYSLAGQAEARSAMAQGETFEVPE